jgi:hypothetical protein
VDTAPMRTPSYFHIIVSVWGAVGRYAAPPDLDSEYFHSAKSN